MAAQIGADLLLEVVSEWLPGDPALADLAEFVLEVGVDDVALALLDQPDESAQAEADRFEHGQRDVLPPRVGGQLLEQLRLGPYQRDGGLAEQRGSDLLDADAHPGEPGLGAEAGQLQAQDQQVEAPGLFTGGIVLVGAGQPGELLEIGVDPGGDPLPAVGQRVCLDLLAVWADQEVLGVHSRHLLAQPAGQIGPQFGDFPNRFCVGRGPGGIGRRTFLVQLEQQVGAALEDPLAEGRRERMLDGGHVLVEVVDVLAEVEDEELGMASRSDVMGAGPPRSSTNSTAPSACSSQARDVTGRNRRLSHPLHPNGDRLPGHPRHRLGAARPDPPPTRPRRPACCRHSMSRPSRRDRHRQPCGFSAQRAARTTHPAVSRRLPARRTRSSPGSGRHRRPCDRQQDPTVGPGHDSPRHRHIHAHTAPRPSASACRRHSTVHAQPDDCSDPTSGEDLDSARGRAAARDAGIAGDQGQPQRLGERHVLRVVRTEVVMQLMDPPPEDRRLMPHERQYLVIGDGLRRFSFGDLVASKHPEQCRNYFVVE